MAGVVSNQNRPSLTPQNEIALTIADFLGTNDSSVIAAVESSFEERIAASEKEVPAKTPYEIFWGLLKEWWKQLIDGRYHKFTAMVFDKGLHDGPVEPGFIASAKKASRFISKALLKDKAPITVPLYKKTHEIACAHFAGEATETLIPASQAGKFLVGGGCSGPAGNLFSDPEFDRTRSKALKITWEFKRNSTSYQEKEKTDPNSLVESIHMTYEAYAKRAEEANRCLIEARNKAEAQSDELNKYITEQSKILGKDTPIATTWVDTGTVFIIYNSTPEEAEILVKKLFEDFEKNIAIAETEDQKIRCIAYLYQMLEWIHPFEDGQGRTDLMLLSALLCKYGLNPAILDDPYISTFCSFEDWVAYLKKGMAKWREEFTRIHSVS